MRIFSDARILLNNLFSYGSKLQHSYQTKKQLSDFLTTYSAYYGVDLITNPTVTNRSQIVELDSVAIGKEKPIAIYMVIPYDDAKWIHTQRKFLDAYRKGQWKIARFYIRGLPNVKSTGLRDLAWRGRLHKYYDTMLARMDGEAPNHWDGVFRISKTKINT